MQRQGSFKPLGRPHPSSHSLHPSEERPPAVLNLGAPPPRREQGRVCDQREPQLTALKQLFSAEAAFLSQQVQAKAGQEFSQGAVDSAVLYELFETWLALP